MPRYVFLCPDCGREDEQNRAVADRNEPAPCPACPGQQHRQFCPQVNFESFGEVSWSESQFHALERRLAERSKS
jgi:putative FmdB family regulatory protein